VHEGYLGNAPHGRLQVHGFWNQQCLQYWPKTSVRERRCSKHENQTDSDVRLGWFYDKGFAALKAYLSFLEWDISAQLFPYHWEFDSCAFGEWWWRELYLSKCYCTYGELTSMSAKQIQCKLWWPGRLWSGSRLRLATEQATQDATGRDEILSSNVMSAPLLGWHLSTPPFFRPGNLYLAIKLATSLSEATTSGGFGNGLLLRTSHVWLAAHPAILN
jgi:hypothetical protein